MSWGDWIAFGALCAGLLGWGAREIRLWVKDGEMRAAAEARGDAVLGAVKGEIEKLTASHSDLADQFRLHEKGCERFRGAMDVNYAGLVKTSEAQQRALERMSAQISRFFRPNTAVELPPEI